jgi:hypothetical protein
MLDMQLTEFLLARIAEDELTAYGGGNWPAYVQDAYAGAPVTPFNAEARLLADCAAKRALVERHGGEHVCEDGLAGRAWDDDLEDIVEAPCDDLRILGAVYADHPDYDEAWRP